IIATDQACFDWAIRPDGRPILPLFHLAAVLRAQTGQSGCLAHWFINEPAIGTLRADTHWWQALLGSVLEQTAPPGQWMAPGVPAEATRQAAFASIDSERDALPTPEAKALASAWQTMDIDGTLGWRVDGLAGAA
ncbi:MAG TPA: hypothetical protein VES73_11750, partial [Lamprocystis sp. (in: g-proteobacteria)]|nr:hypothetical protein [Lamprocystis sp. (in: g-proteobacteria)]